MNCFADHIPAEMIIRYSANEARHEKMVSLAERMLELHKSPSARTPGEKERVKREIEATDRAIDRLVYELYGLTENEIRIVEGT
jgi:hypothetical protein